MPENRRISIVFGTRPEAIKLAPVVLGCRAREGLATSVCVTAQHREMLEHVLETFGIVPDVDLALMTPDQLQALSARAIEGIDRYLGDVRPDLVLVQGDTTTTFCAASYFLGDPTVSPVFRVRIVVQKVFPEPPPMGAGVSSSCRLGEAGVQCG